MPSVGSYLRELRQRRGVALDEISRSTRVPQRYLESLEVDDFATLPEAPFTRGFIAPICQALANPPDERPPSFVADVAGKWGRWGANRPAAAPGDRRVAPRRGARARNV